MFCINAYTFNVNCFCGFLNGTLDCRVESVGSDTSVHCTILVMYNVYIKGTYNVESMFRTVCTVFIRFIMSVTVHNVSVTVTVHNVSVTVTVHNVSVTVTEHNLLSGIHFEFITD